MFETLSSNVGANSSIHKENDNSPSISRTMIQKLIDSGNVKVNETIQKASYKVSRNDIIEVLLEEPVERLDIKPQNIDLDVIYEDEDIIVINKPKGLVVHPGNGNLEGTLVNAVMARCKGSLSGIGGEIRPGIVHRLDKDTSGIIIVAKNDNAHLNLSTQIKNREVKKTYIALVRGVIKENQATIDMPIGRHINVRVKMAVRKDGKSAVTHFTVLKRYESYTLLKINIETGRTHQIRVHLAEIGHPIVGDMVYSNGKNPFNVEGQMLHASKIEFKHPTTGAMMVLEAELPEYFKKVILDIDKGFSAI
ncbi:MAG: RluA family pseudouridine synthase [Oscillospiraceae bacterium]|nr:RluA family pseudouridine synthase [Oscillospiraceae bacterium]